jgi:hypothetical protein
MIDPQTAQQAASAIPGQGVITYAALALVITNIVGLARAGFKALAQRRNGQEVQAQGTGSVNVEIGHPLDGVAPAGCPYHVKFEGRMSAVETTSQSLTSAIAASRHENRQDHQQIFAKLQELAVAQAAQGAKGAGQAAKGES